MGAWDIVDQYYSISSIDLTWSFRCKWYPDGLVKKFKSRFYARGDQEWEEIDLFVTYAPVVQWIMVLLISILEVLLCLKSNQGNATAAFLHAGIPDTEKVYVEIPGLFEQS